MKILIDASASFHYHSTGIGAYASELINAIKSENPSHEIFLFCGKKAHPLSEQMLPPPQTEHCFWERTANRAKPDFSEFDIYHNLHNGIGMIGGPRRKIVTIHDMIPLLLPEFCGSPYKELFLSQTITAAKNCDAVITVSQNSKTDILRFTGIDEERVHVITEAPKHHCKPLPNTMAADFLRSRYHLQAPFFLYIGGFNQRKNVAGLIRGYAAVYRKFPYICPLVIIGKEGSRRKQLEELADSLSISQYLRFIGYVPDGELPFFYNQCKALIYPSHYEGFGLPPLEAAACGAAVIVSDRASLPETMGDGALYINADDPAAIGEQLFTLISDEKLLKVMATKAYTRSKLFSYQTTARQTLKLYENICR